MAEPSNPAPTNRHGPGINVSLFIATLFSTWFVGAGGFDFALVLTLHLFGLDLDSNPGPTLNDAAGTGLIHMACLVGILLSHEMGHYLMARRNRVDASLPYFLPFPFLLFGTLGAVIVMRSRIQSRDALMEVGAAGPLAGVALAIPILTMGLSLSPVEPIPASGIMEGKSLLYLLLQRLAVGDIPAGYDVMLHPMAWAGWIGLLVTMLNLLPIGQLDGGHIFYALFGTAHHGRASRIFLAGLFVLGLSVMGYGALQAERLALTGDAYWAHVMPGGNWLFLGLLLLILMGRKQGRGFGHPPTDDETLSPTHRAIGIGCILLFIVTFMPVPLRVLV